MKPKFYCTTAIPYVNAVPHLGHSYEMVATDVIARYKRLAGYDVWFLTGVDENSLNSEKKARELGREPQDYVDEMAETIQKTWGALKLSNDDFVRTTEERHKRAAHEFFRRSYENGDIYQASYEGYYCRSCEAFYDEDELKEGGVCPVHESACEWLSESNYFFRLSKYEDKLREYITSNPGFVEPTSRRNEVLAFIDRGLKDFSVSRESVKWGIPTPVDPEHVIYVWFDALINYLTGVGFPDDTAKFDKYWPCDIHVIGKDIWRFHCIYWPAMLMSAGVPIPEKVFVHGFVTLGGEKMSKSRGIYVDPVAAVEEYGSDAIRYFLVREVPFGSDGDFSWETFVARYNADLANDLGNLLSRTLNLVQRHFDRKTPPVGETLPEDTAVAEFAAAARDSYVESMDRYQLHMATDHAISIVRTANKYLADTQPWATAKASDMTRTGTILYTAMEALRWASVLVSPVAPDAAVRVQAQLGVNEEQTQDLASLQWGGLTSGDPIGKLETLFPRIQIKVEETPATQPTEATAKGSNVTETAKKDNAESTGIITFDDFMKVDLRVAEVLEASPIEGADKLLKLSIRVGEETRSLVAGVAQYYTAEQMVGKRIVVVANLKPRKVWSLRGCCSRGRTMRGISCWRSSRVRSRRGRAFRDP
ncbi:MAG: methionine--tRNA ligase [Candidatus Poribacteria bacterium]|nr:methionine--tRNA ligase [Candidatus Poribacteria bacterium]